MQKFEGFQQGGDLIMSHWAARCQLDLLNMKPPGQKGRHASTGLACITLGPEINNIKLIISAAGHNDSTTQTSSHENESSPMLRAAVGGPHTEHYGPVCGREGADECAAHGGQPVPGGGLLYADRLPHHLHPGDSSSADHALRI